MKQLTCTRTPRSAAGCWAEVKSIRAELVSTVVLECSTWLPWLDCHTGKSSLV